jgi:hypothetical protein
MGLVSTFVSTPIQAVDNVYNDIGYAVAGLFGLGPAPSNAPEKSLFNISDFKTEVMSEGLADECRFEVYISTPLCLQSSNYSQYMKPTLLRVESVQFPPLIIATRDRAVYGARQPMPIAADYGGEQGVTITFLLDRDLNTKNMFEWWMNSIVDPNSQLVSYQSTYVCDICISSLDRNDGSTYMTIIEDAYPRYMSVVDASVYATGFMRVSINFVFRKWTSREVGPAMQQQQSTQAGYVSNTGTQSFAAMLPSVSGASSATSTSDMLSAQVNNRAAAIQSISSQYGYNTSVSTITSGSNTGFSL